MDRALRIIGITLVLALPIWAYRSFDRALSAAASASTPESSNEIEADPGSGVPEDLALSAIEGSASSSAAVGPDGEATELDGYGDPPEYLAFDAGPAPLAARPYQVADDPDVGDRDVEPSPDRLADYPPETDLVSDFSLAVADAIEPGLYASAFDVKGCGYELRRVDRSGESRLIGQERLGQGRLLVSINPIEPDLFTSVPQCRSWRPWSPLVEPLVRAGTGDYWIGDLARGSWSVPEGCLWEKVVAFRGARLADVTASGLGPAPLVVDEDTIGVRIRGCDRNLALVEAEPPSPLGFEPGLGADAEPDPES